jgi:alkylation response protein AidB-like acyl-CoA dehydrogenase
MGFRMSSTAELFFRDVRVPEEHLVGELNKGFYHLVKLLNMTRIGFAASTLGIGGGAFDRALRYAQEREQSGRKIGEFQAIQHKLAEMATKIETAHLLVYKAAWNYDEGKITPELSSMAKWYSARMAVEVCEEAIQIFGGAGYFLENEVERFYRDARVGEIVEGTREIQKNIIARSLMK